MKNRNVEYEKRIKTYLFKGDSKRCKKICEKLGIINNLRVLECGE